MILVMSEGLTEKNALNKLRERKIIEFDDLVLTGSAGTFHKRAVDILYPRFELGSPFNIVIMRDLDSGKTVEKIKESTRNAMRKALEKARIDEKIEFENHQEYSNIFFIEKIRSKFSVVLHIAQIESDRGFKNCTTDDYILNLAMRTKTIENLKEFGEARKENPQLTPEEVQRKIKEEILPTLEENGIRVREAKGLVNLYIAVLQIGGEGSLRYGELPGEVIERAEEEDIREVFESWIAAFNVIKEVDL